MKKKKKMKITSLGNKKIHFRKARSQNLEFLGIWTFYLEYQFQAINSFKNLFIVMRRHKSHVTTLSYGVEEGPRNIPDCAFSTVEEYILPPFSELAVYKSIFIAWRTKKFPTRQRWYTGWFNHGLLAILVVRSTNTTLTEKRILK